MNLSAAVSKYARGVAYSCYLFSPLGIRSAENRALIARIPKWLGYQEVAPAVPKIAVEDICHELPVRLFEATERTGNVSLLELLVIVNLVAALRPKRIFEIGTFDGRTTLNLAANAPEALVYTLDLPGYQLNATKLPIARGDEKLIDKRASGTRFVNTSFASQIVQLYGDSATFDYGPHLQDTDFVFVDGAHSYDYATSDSANAFRLTRSPGIIVWHDYTNFPGVTRTLNQLFQQGHSLQWVEGTTLVLART